jgi:uncharacterized membrane protein
MTIALTALGSGMVALYLHLWKLGLMGDLTCGLHHACETVQLGPWGSFLGMDVAFLGVLGYAAILVVALLGVSPVGARTAWPTYVLMALIYGALLFTLRLKYAEFVLMHTFCKWCAVSALTILLQSGLVTLDYRRVRSGVGA